MWRSASLRSAVRLPSKSSLAAGIPGVAGDQQRSTGVSASGQSRKTVGTPALAADTVMTDEKAVRIVAVFRRKQARIVRSPERILPALFEKVTFGYIRARRRCARRCADARHRRRHRRSRPRVPHSWGSAPGEMLLAGSSALSFAPGLALLDGTSDVDGDPLLDCLMHIRSSKNAPLPP